MSKLNKADLKSIFKKGAIPTEAQFASLIDSQVNLEETSSGTQSLAIDFKAGFMNLSGSQPFYGIITPSPLTGSNASFHGGIDLDIGQPLPNSPYIKTNGGFDILMDNANQGPLGGDTQTEPLFRIYRGTGIANISPGVELLKLNQHGGLKVVGAITSSGAISASGNLTVAGNINANGNIVGDDVTKITNIDQIECDRLAADANTTTVITLENTQITALVNDTDVFDVSETLFTHGIPVKFNSTIVGQRLPIKNLTGASETLTAAESGKLCLFSDADGAVVTLPDSGGGSIVGVYYHFYVSVAATSNVHRINVADTTNEDIEGYLHVIDADNAAAQATVANRALNSDGFDAISMDGTTTGTIGTVFRITNVAADRWYVTGHIVATGTPATPFVAS